MKDPNQRRYLFTEDGMLIDLFLDKLKDSLYGKTKKITVDKLKLEGGHEISFVAYFKYKKWYQFWK